MNPNNGPTPYDYLNQIAPEAPKKPLFALNLRTVVFGAVAAVILIIIIAVVSGAATSSSKEPWQQLSARLAVTATVVDGASASIKNSQLRSMNSDLKLYITNTQRDLTKPLSALDINPAKIPATIVAKEKGTGIDTRLEDGRLNAKYDSTYAREMTYQLATILSQLQKLYAGNNGPKTKELLKNAYDNLLPTYTSISEFSTANE
jgi:nitrogen fixation/metabolism regulation signal transduction histidine kinase